MNGQPIDVPFFYFTNPQDWTMKKTTLSTNSLQTDRHHKIEEMKKFHKNKLLSPDGDNISDR